MNHIRTSTVTTRKPHVCNACLRKFPKGTRMRISVYAHGGEAWNWRECPTCAELLDIDRGSFADYDDTLAEGCVVNSLNGESPEEFLESLKRVPRKDADGVEL
jgi:hypothetical protein